jgi:hypothetical protein
MATRVRKTCEEKFDECKEKREAKGTRAKKDPNAPKRPRSGFMFYGMARRAALKEENPELSFGEIGRALGEEWTGMSDAKKAPYVKKATADKARYAKEMASWEAGSAKKSPKAGKAGKAKKPKAKKVVIEVEEVSEEEEVEEEKPAKKVGRPAKKAPVKKAPVKKAPVKKVAVKKAPVKKAPIKKASPTKKKVGRPAKK